MKKISLKVIIMILISTIIIFINNIISNAASTSLSANEKEVSVGDSVTINVSADAMTWNLKVSGSGISDKIVGGNLDEIANKSTSKSYKLDTSKPGTYTVSLSGDVTDANGASSDVSKSVTITVKQKEAPKPETPPKTNTTPNTSPNGNTNTNNDTTQAKPQEPTFTDTNQTVYSTTEGINVRSSYSTSSNSIGSLKKGESVIRIGIGSNGWSKVKYNGTTAYISSSLLTTEKPEEEEKSSDKALKTLEIEDGVMSPEFDPETTQYEISVGSDVEKLKITATPNDDKAKVEIQGNENLKIGENSVKIVVTAEDQTARTYNVLVRKSEKEPLALATLKIDNLKLTPKFSPSVYEYKVDLTDNIDKLNIEAKCDDENVTVEILGNENLKSGENIITIMLKSKDETKSATYQIIVNKKEAIPEETGKTEEKSGSFDNFGTEQMIIVGIAVLCVIILIIIIIIIKKMIKEKREDDDINFNFMDDIKEFDNEEKTENMENIHYENNEVNKFNLDETVSSIEKNTVDDDTHKLYNVENEIDFKNNYLEESKSKKRGKRKGKHF